MTNNKINPNDIVVIDANFNNNETDLSELKKLLGFLHELGYYVVYECKGKKAKKIADPELLKYVSLLRMNKTEYEELFKALAIKGINVEESKKDAYLSSVIGQRKMPNLI
jgi:hypothetical protein